MTDALTLAAAVRRGTTTATALLAHTLESIQARNPALNCFTQITQQRAEWAAAAVDRAVAAGIDPGPLAGVPFAVKNLFDIDGEVTLAGAKLNAERPPASTDATLVARLEAAGAVLVGALNMDEYAYGFVTINSHYGPTPNPHDLSRMAGGSSGGSAAAVAAGLVPLTLGSDTNGSIRVPAALCGVYGLKPTYGGLSRAGAFLFAASFDHVGPFARTVGDLAVAYDVLQGPDPCDPVCTARAPVPVIPLLGAGLGDLRLASLGGYFTQAMDPAVRQGFSSVVAALQVTERVTLPETARARAAAFIITACEGSQLHRTRLQQRWTEFDPATRDRFLAGALIPNGWYLQAQRFRQWYRQQVMAVFEDVDVLIAPATPCVAPKLDQTELTLNGQSVPLRPNLGLYTQPLSFIGLPVLTVPVAQGEGLPVGLQLVAAPHREAHLFRVAAWLEQEGITAAGVPRGFA